MEALPLWSPKASTSSWRPTGRWWRCGSQWPPSPGTQLKHSITSTGWWYDGLKPFDFCCQTSTSFPFLRMENQSDVYIYNQPKLSYFFYKMSQVLPMLGAKHVSLPSGPASAPRLAIAKAMEKPKPLSPPVTKASFPERFLGTAAVICQMVTPGILQHVMISYNICWKKQQLHDQWYCYDYMNEFLWNLTK